MANVLIGKIEIALEDVVHWLVGVRKFVVTSSKVVTTLGTLVEAVGKVINDAQTDLSNPNGLTSITVQNSQLADVKEIWADIKAVFANVGIHI